MSRPRKNVKKFYTRDIRQMERSTFIHVIEAYENIKATLGNAQAIDYSRITGGQGAQFSTDNSKSLALLDFCIDVENTIKNNLTPEEHTFVLDNLAGCELPLKVETEFSMAIQEKLGRLFYARGMYPIRKYFVTVKR
jgi:hypothetical protein